MFCGKHPLLVTRIQVSDPGPKCPLVRLVPFMCINHKNEDVFTEQILKRYNIDVH